MPKEKNLFILMNENDPDFEIEQFWLGFKKSMLNFYEDYLTFFE